MEAADFQIPQCWRLLHSCYFMGIHPNPLSIYNVYQKCNLPPEELELAWLDFQSRSLQPPQHRLQSVPAEAECVVQDYNVVQIH